MIQWPALMKVTVVPVTLQTGSVVELKVTVKPEFDEALSGADPLRIDWVTGPTKVICCEAWLMPKLAEASLAAR